jgi:hypothetical protein
VSDQTKKIGLSIFKRHYDPISSINLMEDKMSAPKALKSLTFTVLPKLARCAAAYGDGRTDNLTPYSENGPDHSEARSVPGYIRPNSIRFQFS